MQNNNGMPKSHESEKILKVSPHTQTIDEIKM